MSKQGWFKVSNQSLRSGLAIDFSLFSTSSSFYSVAMTTAIERFLHSTLRKNHCEDIGFTKGYFVVIATLLVCALLSFSISAFTWFKESANCENTITPKIAENALKMLTSYPSPCKKRIVGYYTEWENTDISKNQLDLMTHAVFVAVQMDANGNLGFHNSHAAQRFSLLKRAAARDGSNVQVMVSIGGYNQSQHFSTVLADRHKKRTFISSIRSFIEKHHIDGVDIFWKWPNVADKYNYALFMKKLRKQLTTRKKRYIISIVLPPPGINNWEMGYALDDIMNSVDFANVFTMDYYGPWPNQWGTPTGPSAPLHDGIGVRSVDWTMNYYTCKIGSGSKLNIVIPFYARLWKNVEDALSSRSEVFRNVTLIEGEAQGMPYISRWTVNHDGYILEPSSWDLETETPYIWDPKNKTFLTFETTRSIKSKTKYVMEMGLGGVWIWSVDQNNQNNGLLEAVSFDKFCDEPSQHIKMYQC